MTHRAAPSGITLSAEDAALIKGMLRRGDRQHDVAAWFGVNGGRIAEISTGQSFHGVEPADSGQLPPAGPYPKPKEAIAAARALAQAREALATAERALRQGIGG